MYRINYEDIVNIALLYEYRVFKTTIFEEEEIKNYVNTFYENLMKSNIDYTSDYYNRPKPIFNYTHGKNKKSYYIIKDDVLDDIEKKVNIGIYPLEIVVESQKDNVLSILGIELKDGKMISKEAEKIKTYRK